MAQNKIFMVASAGLDALEETVNKTLHELGTEVQVISINTTACFNREEKNIEYCVTVHYTFPNLVSNDVQEESVAPVKKKIGTRKPKKK